MKAYTKPVVSSVELVIDQQVLASCKTSNVGGNATTVGVPGAINCIPGDTQCLFNGS
jgi:hypothetical protein